jgi:hypothetical protein
MARFIDIATPYIPNHVYEEALRHGFAQLAYRYGMTEPHYPVPATTLNALIACPYENIMPLIKVWLLER